MNLEEINEAVSKGRKLVIVGNRVCDVESFEKSHPGGEALMNSMIGKDPETTRKLMDMRHTHTKAARNIMEILTIAFYRE